MRVAPAESRVEQLEAARNLEEQVQTARRLDRQEAGAFMTYRRPHWRSPGGFAGAAVDVRGHELGVGSC